MVTQLPQLLSLRLISYPCDGFDDSLVGGIAFDGGSARSEVNRDFCDALQPLQGLLYIGAAVVAHHAVNLKCSCFHIYIMFVFMFMFVTWDKPHHQCIRQKAAQHHAADNVEQRRRLMATGMGLHQMRGEPLAGQQIVHTQAEGNRPERDGQ